MGELSRARNAIHRAALNGDDREAAIDSLLKAHRSYLLNDILKRLDSVGRMVVNTESETAKVTVEWCKSAVLDLFDEWDSHG